MNLEHKGFSSFFPTPKYLLLSAAGLAITDEGVKLLEFKYSLTGVLTLSRHMAFPLPDNAIASGFINDADALKAVLQEISRTGVRYVHATLPEERTYLFTATIDKVPEESLRDAVAFILEENVPLSLPTAVFDYDVVGEAGPDKLKVTVSVLSKKVVDFYVEVLAASGLVPVSFDIESQAIARAIISTSDKSAQLILNLQVGKTGLYVVESGVVQFTTTLPYEASSRLADFKAEILKVFTFWNNRADDGSIPAKIGKALLCGPVVLDTVFLTDLSAECGAEFLPADRLANVAIDPWILPKEVGPEAQGYAAAIGSALASSHARLFKLLPEEGKKKAAAEYGRRRVALALASLTLVLFVGAVGSLPSYLLSRQAPAIGEVSSLVTKGEEAAALSKWLTLEKEKLAILSPTLDRTRISSLVSDISSRKPNGVHITSLAWSLVGTKGGSLTLSGIASDRQSLLSFESGLNVSNLYDDVALPLSSLKKEKDITFQMKLVPKKMP